MKKILKFAHITTGKKPPAVGGGYNEMVDIVIAVNAHITTG